jgi:Family of unknown function (DUF5329)
VRLGSVLGSVIGDPQRTAPMLRSAERCPRLCAGAAARRLGPQSQIRISSNIAMPSIRLCAPLRATALIAFALSAAPALAVEMTAAARKEVDTLLHRIGASGCAFYRSGSWHNAAEAQSHLDRKLRYMVARSMVGTTEEFIAKGATGSSMTGEAYAIRCRNVPAQPSAVWLTSELRTMRQSHAAAATAGHAPANAHPAPSSPRK